MSLNAISSAMQAVVAEVELNFLIGKFRASDCCDTGMRSGGMAHDYPRCRLTHTQRDLLKRYDVWFPMNTDQSQSQKSAAGCPACTAKRIHAADEWLKYHPEAGTGTSKG